MGSWVGHWAGSLKEHWKGPRTARRPRKGPSTATLFGSDTACPVWIRYGVSESDTARPGADPCVGRVELCGEAGAVWDDFIVEIGTRVQL